MDYDKERQGCACLVSLDWDVVAIEDDSRAYEVLWTGTRRIDPYGNLVESV